MNNQESDSHLAIGEPLVPPGNFTCQQMTQFFLVRLIDFFTMKHINTIEFSVKLIADDNNLSNMNYR